MIDLAKYQSVVALSYASFNTHMLGKCRFRTMSHLEQTRDNITAILQAEGEPNHIGDSPEDSSTLFGSMASAFLHEHGMILVIEEQANFNDIPRASVEYARANLEQLRYSDADIDMICEGILACHTAHSETADLASNPQRVLYDADCAWYAAEDFIAQSEMLRLETRDFSPNFYAKTTPRAWHENMLQTLEEHHYCTQGARNLWSEAKSRNKQQLRDLLYSSTQTTQQKTHALGWG